MMKPNFRPCVLIKWSVKMFDSFFNQTIQNLSNDKTITGIWLEFEDNFIGKAACEKCTYYMKENNIPDKWVPINYLKYQIKIGSSYTNIRLIVRKKVLCESSVIQLHLNFLSLRY